MTVIRPHIPLSAWIDRVDARLQSYYGALPASVRPRVRRSVLALVPILQCAVGAALAWLIAHDIVKHSEPFYAPMAAVICLGVAGGKRLNRPVELIAGVVLGVGIGSLLISWVGTGWWQIGAAVAVAMAAAVFADSGAIIPIQSANSAILVATLTSGGAASSVDRMIDALIGGLVGIAVMSLIPVNPIRRTRRDAANVLSVCSDVLRRTALGLRRRDRDIVAAALQKARETQPAVDTLRADVSGGKELGTLSPVFWRSRDTLSYFATMVNPIDNGVRNIRVLTRRALLVVDDGISLDPELIDLITVLGDAVNVLSRMVRTGPEEQPDPVEAARVLRSVARRARPELVDGDNLTTYVILAQLRSTIIDMLQVAGLSKISALATLPPTVSTPAVKPDYDDWRTQKEE